MTTIPGLYTAAIASGSNGNCYYIANEDHAILIDVGISCRELERRMARLRLSMEKVKAIFISHEHSDHIKGLAVVANKYQVPVFISEDTNRACRLAIPERLIYFLHPDRQILVGNLAVTAFRKFHDAADPQSFVVSQNGLSIGVFTDIGQVCDKLIHHFQQSDVAFLETNYDEELLDQGRYPYFLKKRIRGGFGHLSNHEALGLFEQHASPKLRLLFLCHLSRDNNNPQQVLDLFENSSKKTKLVLAGRDQETKLFKIPFVEKNFVSYEDEHITTFQSCTIRWSMQPV